VKVEGEPSHIVLAAPARSGTTHISMMPLDHQHSDKDGPLRRIAAGNFSIMRLPEWAPAMLLVCGCLAVVYSFFHSIHDHEGASGWILNCFASIIGGLQILAAVPILAPHCGHWGYKFRVPSLLLVLFEARTKPAMD